MGLYRSEPIGMRTGSDVTRVTVDDEYCRNCAYAS